MTRVLLTAFEPYAHYTQNSSWLALVELVKDLPANPEVVTRLYPVDFDTVCERLEQDLAQGFDYSIHLGQAPGSARIQLEAIGINMGGRSSQPPDEHQPLIPTGPTAYQTTLPLNHWAKLLRKTNTPTQVSYHAGTYLCNATLYFAHYLTEQKKLPTRSVFIHLPLDTAQVIDETRDVPSLPRTDVANALRLILDELV